MAIPTNHRIAFSFMTAFALAPAMAAACEPFVPLVYLYSGPNLVGQSLIAFLSAVALKCILFAVFDRRLDWPQAIGLMLVANVVSSIIGLFVSFGAVSSVFILMGLVVVPFVSIKPAERVKALWRGSILDHVSAGAIAAGITFLYFVTFVLFLTSQGFADTGGTVSYWLLKIAYVYIALLISIFLTTLWEEWVIGALAGQKHAGAFFMGPVLKANLIVLLVIMAYAAILMLPKRLQSPSFLIPAAIVERMDGAEPRRPHVSDPISADGVADSAVFSEPCKGDHNTAQGKRSAALGHAPHPTVEPCKGDYRATGRTRPLTILIVSGWMPRLMTNCLPITTPQSLKRRGAEAVKKTDIN